MPRLIITTIILYLLSVVTWGEYISSYAGYLYKDSGHLNYCYQQGFAGFPFCYLPWESAHRPIGRHVINFLFWVFGENPIPIINAQLAIHTLNALILYLIIIVFTQSFPLALVGSIVFLTLASSFLPVYWTAALFDLLSTTFILSATLAILFVTSQRFWLRTLAIIGMYLCFLGAVKTKESTIVYVIPVVHLFLWLRVNARVVIDQTTDVYNVSLRCALVNLRKYFSWSDVFWLGILTVLALILATHVDSDFLSYGIEQTDPAYRRDYSLITIFRSYGWDMATLFYSYGSSEPIPPVWAFLIILTITMLAIISKNFLILWGVIWWFTLLFFLAVLPKQYQSPNYPYLAGVGWAIFCVGALWQLTSLLSHPRRQQLVRWSVSCLLVISCPLILNNWLQHGILPVWAKNFHQDNSPIVRGLRSLIPEPSANAEFIFVSKKFTILDQNLKVFLAAIYRRSGFSGSLFKSLDEGRRKYA
ncbi:MAG: hypothetical protein IT292_06765 [Deltaproteobacteria bacterium]|nr:hypothetical protein [Deltaproteobacteria bacterium]